MRPAQVDLKVLEIVEAVRRGAKVEDDLVECKWEWPETSRVRQFAALCNKARGSEVLLIVGLDERDGTVNAQIGTDPASWWHSFEARFDEAAPDLTSHLRVAVGDGEFVTALIFDTSRVPFVVKSPPGSAVDREVPIRAGTRTRSAHRRELLQLLAPTIRLPTLILLTGAVKVEWHAAVEANDEASPPRPARAEHASVGVDTSIYVEHLVPEFVMIPKHQMRARLRFGDQELALKPNIHVPSSFQNTPGPAPKQFGVDHRREGVLVTGPGVMWIGWGEEVPLDKFAELDGSDACRLASIHRGTVV